MAVVSATAATEWLAPTHSDRCCPWWRRMLCARPQTPGGQWGVGQLEEPVRASVAAGVEGIAESAQDGMLVHTHSHKWATARDRRAQGMPRRR